MTNFHLLYYEQSCVFFMNFIDLEVQSEKNSEFTEGCGSIYATIVIMINSNYKIGTGNERVVIIKYKHDYVIHYNGTF